MHQHIHVPGIMYIHVRTFNLTFDCHFNLLNHNTERHSFYLNTSWKIYPYKNDHSICIIIKDFEIVWKDWIIFTTKCDETIHQKNLGASEKNWKVWIIIKYNLMNFNSWYVNLKINYPEFTVFAVCKILWIWPKM